MISIIEFRDHLPAFGTKLHIMHFILQVSLAIFAMYVLISPDNILDADKAFVTLSYINLFNYSLSNLPIAVNNIGQVSIIELIVYILLFGNF